MSRRLLGALGIAGAALVCGLVWWVAHRAGGSGVPTLTVARASFERRIIAEGNLEAAEATPVTAPVDAQGQLKVAVDYAERKGLTSGYTSVWWTTPDEDLGFWFQNLAAALDELERISPDASQLERTNVLMKLRETILDQNKDGSKVTVPMGISIFPDNTFYWAWGFLSFIVASAVLGRLLFRVLR